MAGVSSDQPFYHILPDSYDCTAFLGGPYASSPWLAILSRLLVISVLVFEQIACDFCARF